MTKAEQKNAVFRADGGAGIQRSGVNPLRNVVDDGGNRPPSGPFAEHALNYHTLGLPVIPLVSDDKSPLVAGFKTWKRHPGPAAIHKWVNDPKHAGANIGVISGRHGGPNWIDYDAGSPDNKPGPEVLDALLERCFGAQDVPAVLDTACGWRIPFRPDGESSSDDLRLGFARGHKVELLAEGRNAVLPPSIHPDTGKPYVWQRGSIEALLPANLPRLDPGIATKARRSAARRPRLRAVESGKIPKGRRNTDLLALVRKYCGQGATLAEVRAVALARAAELWDRPADDPYPDAKILREVQSLWKGYDRSKAAKGVANAYVTISRSELSTVPSRDWGAVGFLAWLKLQHPKPCAKGFAIDCEKVAEAIGDGVTPKIVRGWREKLHNMGSLVRLHRGSGRGNPHLFTFLACSSVAGLMPSTGINVLSVNPPIPDRAALGGSSQQRASPQLIGDLVQGVKSERAA